AANVTEGPNRVKVDFTVTDDLSGVKNVEAVFEAPSGTVRHAGSALFDSTRNVNGVLFVDFPRNSESGRWTLTRLFLADAAGNTRTMDAADLEQAGFGGHVDVSASRDTVSPQLTMLKLSANEIDTSAAPVTLRVDVNATDDQSGIKTIELVFVSPSGAI